MIEMSKAYYPHYSNRKDGYVDIYFDEEFLMKETSEPNIGATVAWKKWQDKTGHMALPGSVLHGTVCVIQKDLIPNLRRKVMTKESLNDSLFELNKLILDLRSKLSKSLQEVLKLRKDLDLEKEEHQLTVLKYNKLKDAITLEIDNKLNKARGAVEEIQK